MALLTIYKTGFLITKGLFIEVTIYKLVYIGNIVKLTTWLFIRLTINSIANIISNMVHAGVL